VIPKLCSADLWWSVNAYINQYFCALRTTKLSQVVRAPEKFGNHCPRHITAVSKQNKKDKVDITLAISDPNM